MRRILIACILLSSANALAIDQIRIDVGRNYKDYSNEELRRRVYDLERAVAQLQEQVFQLAVRNNGGGVAPAPQNPWTCQIQAFASTYVASGNTRSSALAQVLKKCSDATNAIHCKEADAKCGND